MELISYMCQLSVLLYVYNNQVFLLESRYDATKDDLKNALLWTADALETDIIVTTFTRT
jgi:hypothetical protein